jgi:hypothetical protein
MAERPKHRATSPKEETTMIKTYHVCAHCGTTYEAGTAGTTAFSGFTPGELVMLCAKCEARARRGGRVPRAIARSIIARGGWAWLENQEGWFRYRLDEDGRLVAMRAAYSPAFNGCNSYSREVRVRDLGPGKVRYSSCDWQ